MIGRNLIDVAQSLASMGAYFKINLTIWNKLDAPKCEKKKHVWTPRIESNHE